MHKLSIPVGPNKKRTFRGIVPRKEIRRKFNKIVSFFQEFPLLPVWVLNSSSLSGFAWFLSLIDHHLDYTLPYQAHKMRLLLGKHLRFGGFLLLIILLGQVQLEAQSNAAKVQAIDEVYRQARINISQKKWLSNHLTINLKRHDLNHSGYYHYSEKFYYALKAVTPLLQLALVRREKESVDYQQEFLFNLEGKLIYFHEKQNDVKKHPYREVKVYFERGKLLVWNQSNQTSLRLKTGLSPKERVKIILKEARLLQKKLAKQIDEMWFIF